MATVLGLGCSLIASEPAPAPAPVSATAASLEAQDLTGATVRPFCATNASWHVLIFMSVDCPICNRYAPEIRRLAEDYSRRGVQFWMVHPLEDETPAGVEAHTKEYQLPGKVLLDPRRVLCNFAGATVTPEAVLVDRDLRIRYQGRISDRFPALGREQAMPRDQSLRNALEAVLSGKPVDPARTKAIGCTIPPMTPTDHGR